MQGLLVKSVLAQMNQIHFTILLWMRQTSCEWKDVGLWAGEQLSVCLTWLVSTNSKYSACLFHLAGQNKRFRKRATLWPFSCFCFSFSQHSWTLYFMVAYNQFIDLNFHWFNCETQLRTGQTAVKQLPQAENTNREWPWKIWQQLAPYHICVVSEIELTLNKSRIYGKIMEK